MMCCEGCHHKLKPPLPKVYLFGYHLNMYLSLLWIKYSLNCVYVIWSFCLIYVYNAVMHSSSIDIDLHVMHPFSNAPFFPGGSTLYIETCLSRSITSESKEGGGAMQLTGNLGNVMKESAEIAYTFAKSFLLDHPTEEGGIPLQTSQVHLHVPEVISMCLCLLWICKQICGLNFRCALLILLISLKFVCKLFIM